LQMRAFPRVRPYERSTVVLLHCTGLEVSHR
jgi:hypothetical protein